MSAQETPVETNVLAASKRNGPKSLEIELLAPKHEALRLDTQKIKAQRDQLLAQVAAVKAVGLKGKANRLTQEIKTLAPTLFANQTAMKDIEDHIKKLLLQEEELLKLKSLPRRQRQQQRQQPQEEPAPRPKYGRAPQQRMARGLSRPVKAYAMMKAAPPLGFPTLALLAPAFALSAKGLGAQSSGAARPAFAPAAVAAAHATASAPAASPR